MMERAISSRRSLSRDRIVEAALALIDAEGVAALSARRLADRLGCKAMSLYNHVDGMDDLLDGVVDHLLGQALGGVAEGRPGEGARAYLAMAEAHHEAFALVATRVWRGPNGRAAAMSFVRHYVARGFDEREALRRARILGAYLNGAGLALGAWKRGAAGADDAQTAIAVRSDLDAGLKALIASLNRPVAT